MFTDGSSEKYDAVIHCTGQTHTNHFSIDGKQQDSYLEVDDYLQVKGLSDVYAIGDCTSGTGWYKCAIAANGMAEHLAKRLQSLLKGDTPEGEVYKSKGESMILLPMGRS